MCKVFLLNDLHNGDNKYYFFMKESISNDYCNFLLTNPNVKKTCFLIFSLQSTNSSSATRFQIDYSMHFLNIKNS